MILKDEILEEVRNNKETLAKNFKFDLGLLCRQLREEEKKSTRPVVVHPHSQTMPDQKLPHSK